MAKREFVVVEGQTSLELGAAIGQDGGVDPSTKPPGITEIGVLIRIEHIFPMIHGEPQRNAFRRVLGDMLTEVARLQDIKLGGNEPKVEAPPSVTGIPLETLLDLGGGDVGLLVAESPQGVSMLMIDDKGNLRRRFHPFASAGDVEDAVPHEQGIVALWRRWIQRLYRQDSLRVDDIVKDRLKQLNAEQPNVLKDVMRQLNATSNKNDGMILKEILPLVSDREFIASLGVMVWPTGQR